MRLFFWRKAELDIEMAFRKPSAQAPVENSMTPNDFSHRVFYDAVLIRFQPC
jgi:hypothetical protein